MISSTFVITPLLATLDFTTLPQQIINGLLSGSIYALIALGYTMVYGILKLINFAHGEVFMLGAYTALFVSWAFGFTPDAGNHATSIWYLLVMLLASMTVSGFAGIVIERFAYRPLRNQPRIAALITAIGMSTLLQYGGQVFLPNSPPPNIDQRINPYQRNIEIAILPHSAAIKQKLDTLKPQKQAADNAWLNDQKTESNPFYPSAQGKVLKETSQKLDREYTELEGEYSNTGLSVSMQMGRIVTIAVTIVLMLCLTYLVMFTKRGRAMRAVSHDFDSASLMGINVDAIITFTFIIGSVLAGAGAMLDATLYQPGLEITTFFGLLPGVKAFVAAVLGGIGNIPGAVIGGLLMGVIESLVGWMGYTGWQDAAAFIVLIVVLLVKPSGILGSNVMEKV